MLSVALPVVQANAIVVPPARIQGAVTSAASGAPLAGVQVYATSFGIGGRVDVGPILTDVNGAYSLDLEPECWTVEFRDPSGSFAVVDRLQCVGEGDLALLDAAMSAGGRIAGEVTDSVTGLPVPFACFDVWDAGIEATMFTSPLCADAAGLFETPGLVPDTYALQFNGLLADGSPSGYQPLFAFVLSIVVTAGNTTTVSPTLDPIAPVAGSIQVDGVGSDSGDPVDACFQIIGTLGYNDVACSLTGSVTFTNVPDDSYVVTGTPRDIHYDQDQVLSVIVAADAPTASLTFPRMSTIAGTVLDGGGLPAEGVLVTVCSAPADPVSFVDCGVGWPSVSTGVDGSYQIGPLAAGDWLVHFGGTDDEWVEQWFDGVTDSLLATNVVVAAATDVVGIDAAVARKTTISGVVTTAGGDPIEGAKVHVVRSDALVSQTVRTAADGSYVLDRIDPGDYALDVVAFGFAPATLDPVTLDAAVSTVVSDIQLDAEAVITGTVTPALPALSAQEYCVQVAVAGTQSVVKVRCFALGSSFLLNGLPAGDYDVSVSSNGFITQLVDGDLAPGVGPFTLLAGDNIVADVVLERGPVVSGVVVDDVTRTPLTSGLVGVFDQNFFTQLIPVGADGTFTFYAPAGSYSVGALSDGYLVEYWDDAATLVGATPVVVTTADVSGIVIDLVRAPQVSGTVTSSATGLPVAGIDVEYVCDDGRSGSAVTGSDGTYVLAVGVGNCLIDFVDFGGVYKGEYWPNTDAAHATALVTSAGSTHPGVNASLTPLSATVPGSPTGAVAVPGNGAATVSWSAPSSDGGSLITGYTVTASPGGATCSTSGALSCGVSGLANGTAYTFTVAATNDVGASAPSAASAAVTPVSVPLAPAAPTGTPKSKLVLLSWVAPGNNGSAITDYVVQYRLTTTGTWSTFPDPVSAATTATVTGLLNGKAYVFRVAAVNALGTGAFSAESAAITPRTVPSAPKAPAVTPKAKSAVLKWSAPNNGGSPITDYVVQYSSNNGVTWVTFKDGVKATTGAKVTGLVTGKKYVFRVAAKNAAGRGAFGPKSLVVKIL